jgi:hypothetical protein
LGGVKVTVTVWSYIDKILLWRHVMQFRMRPKEHHATGPPSGSPKKKEHGTVIPYSFDTFPASSPAEKQSYCNGASATVGAAPVVV